LHNYIVEFLATRTHEDIKHFKRYKTGKHFGKYTICFIG